MTRPDVKDKLAAMNADAVSSTPEAADTYVRRQIATTATSSSGPASSRSDRSPAISAL